MNKTRIAISASGTTWGSAVVKPSWNRAALDVWPGDYSPVNAASEVRRRIFSRFFSLVRLR